MDNQLEQARDAWVNAFFTGNVELLAHYEDEDFKVVYTAESCVENRETRYANIQHAVNNGVWKPIKPNVDSATGNACALAKTSLKLSESKVI